MQLMMCGLQSFFKNNFCLFFFFVLSSYNYEQSRLTPTFCKDRLISIEWMNGTRIERHARGCEADELTKLASKCSSCLIFLSVISSLFMHFLCNSAKYFTRWACRYGSCLWGNLKAQQWKGCVSQAYRRF